MVSSALWSEGFHRVHEVKGFIGFVVSMVSWFDRFLGVKHFNGIMVSSASRSEGFIGFMKSRAS